MLQVKVGPLQPRGRRSHGRHLAFAVRLSASHPDLAAPDGLQVGVKVLSDKMPASFGVHFEQKQLID